MVLARLHHGGRCPEADQLGRGKGNGVFADLGGDVKAHEVGIRRLDLLEPAHRQLVVPRPGIDGNDGPLLGRNDSQGIGIDVSGRLVVGPGGDRSCEGVSRGGPLDA